MKQEPQSPPPVHLPKAPQHPSDPVATTYQDPNAPKPKRKLKVGKLLLLVVLFLALIAGAVFGYLRFFNNSQESTIVENYSGGLSEDSAQQSVMTEETEAAKKFLQAIQQGNAPVVDELASEELKLQVKLESQNDETTVLSYFEGRFDSIDFDTLISTVQDGKDEVGVEGKQVTFSDKTSGEGASGTYRVDVLVIQEAGVYKINSVTSDLTF